MQRATCREPGFVHVNQDIVEGLDDDTVDDLKRESALGCCSSNWKKL